jgi:hypothetical protein
MRCISWHAGDIILGYLEEYPNYWTDGSDKKELEKNLNDIYQKVKSGRLKAPSELENALAKINKTQEDYCHFSKKIAEFLYEYVKGMIKGIDQETGHFVIQARHPKDSILPSHLKILVGEIVGNLRSALDYMIFELSVKNNPNLEERFPQFVIVDDEQKFERASNTGLKYLTDEQKVFVEKIQPYHGYEILKLLRDAANISKHRQPLELRDVTGLDIYYDELSNKELYEGAWTYPQEDGGAIFAKPSSSNGLRTVLMNKYDGLKILGLMIVDIQKIVQASYKYFKESNN